MSPCPSCGSEVASGVRYCSSCGSALAVDSFATRTVALSSTPRGAVPISRERRSSGSRTSAVSQGRFAPGELLGGRYRIVAMLGKGGMGEVYRADDLTLEQPVALKFLPEALTHHEEALARFRNEVRIARQVSHPNVCRVYDLGEMEGLYFLSMEYVDGEDLGSLLRRIGRLPPDKALEIARKLCAGLAAAHEKGVLHRDLKPANVMLDARGQVLLTDFGLAGIAGDIEGAEIRNGTPAYMAPEQLAGQEVTVRSDIYSLGLVLYEIFTGTLPYESETLAGLIRAQKESAPVSPTTLVREMDPAIERIMLRCLQSRPSLRPASALAVAAALPGGDPLAAALAAGETPSPEMVAAAGEGEGLSLRAASALLAVTLVFLVAAGIIAYRVSGLEMLAPEYSPDVLVQKAREHVQALGYGAARPADFAWRFQWDERLFEYLRKDTAPGEWPRVFAQKPPALRFLYRQAQSPITALTFHDDLLTPGIVHWDDPPRIEPGMISLVLDSYGRLLHFERIPDQLMKPDAGPPASADWNLLFAAAGLDAAQFTAAEPVWNSLASSDARQSWDGKWPGSTRPLHVEAASLRGKPVFFSLVHPWTKPERSSGGGSSTQVNVTFSVLGLMVVVICVGAALLARRNLAANRGDRRGAFRLAAFFSSVLLCLWLSKAHFAVSFGTFGMFLLAMCTSVFYGVVIWTVYLALEPYARRRWPQTLISWSSVLIGKFRDPVVGRDVLIGALAGTAVALLNGVVDLWIRKVGPWSPSLVSAEVLNGTRSALAQCLTTIPHSIRETLFFFFLIFLLRVLFRNQWLAAAAFALVFASFNFLSPTHPILAGTVNFLVVFAFAFLVLRWGLLSLAVCIFTANLAGNAPVTGDSSAWYFWYGVFMLAAVVAIAAWAFRVAVGSERLWKQDVFS